jgi:hypothetical protein
VSESEPVSDREPLAVTISEGDRFDQKRGVLHLNFTRGKMTNVERVTTAELLTTFFALADYLWEHRTI